MLAGFPAVCRPRVAEVLLATITVSDGVVAARKEHCAALLDDVMRLRAALAESKAWTGVAVLASKTSVTDVYGVGPIVAAIIIGRSGNVVRFASRDHCARLLPARTKVLNSSSAVANRSVMLPWNTLRTPRAAQTSIAPLETSSATTSNPRVWTLSATRPAPAPMSRTRRRSMLRTGEPAEVHSPASPK